MPKFGKRSKQQLDTLHPDLQLVLIKAIELVDFSIIQGYRGEEEQNEYFAQGKSKLKYPNSKHNTNPSLAVDIAPYPIDWNDLKRFYAVAFFIKGIAYGKGIKLRLGCDWNGDFIFNERFIDAPHIELHSKRVPSEKWIKY